MERFLIFAPNWLGDAVMALPAIADVRRAHPRAALTVAARPAVAPLFALVRDVDDTVVISSGVLAGGLRRAEYDAALLLPNSFNVALRAYRARIPERWGYRADWRGKLLTRAIARPRSVHQVCYYQHLVAALGMPNGADAPAIDLPPAAIDAGARLLRDAGWDAQSRIVAFAPGAAYGGAKRWPPEYFGELARLLAADGIATVMVGTGADAPTGRDVAASAEPARVIDLIGRTTIPELAAVLKVCHAVVSNDSGAMHLAAAVGSAVTALFGPTDETATAPRSAAGGSGPAFRVLTHPVGCRPCMLRDCPIDHACMRELTVERVRRATLEAMS